MNKLIAVTAALSIIVCAPAFGGNSLVEPGVQQAVAKSTLTAKADGEWNRLGRRDGKFVELWTRDGDSLNKVAFFAGVPTGQPLLRELNKKNRPLPKVSGNMLITDIPTLLESSYRIQFNANRFAVNDQEPITFSGYPGIKFTYTFTNDADEVERKGEAVGAFIKNKLYLIAYEAPAIYFFDKDLGAFRKLVSSLKL
jgi:hypothetical protein